MFNTLEGQQSMIKIPVQFSSVVEDVLTKKRQITEVDEIIHESLLKYGYIIQDDCDEEAKLHRIFLKTVADSQLHLTIIPTEKCNFRCKYCYESFPETIMDEKTQNAILLYLKKNLYRYSSLHISWYGGEPLLALDIIERLSFEIKKICAFYKKKYTSSITTNGYLLTAEVFKRLLKCNVLTYQITIDGSKKLHDLQRPLANSNCSTYDIIIDNLINIKSQIESSVFCIVIRSNFSKLHSKYIKQYTKDFNEVFGDDKRFQFFIRPVMDWGGDQVIKFKNNLFEDRNIDDIYDQLISSEHKLNYVYVNFLKHGSGVCDAGKMNYYLISTNGDIHKCTCHFQGETSDKIGQLLPNGDMDIIQEKENKWIYKMDCINNCFFAPICLRCRCSAGKVIPKLGIENICSMEKQSFSKLLQLIDQTSDLFRRI